jgi:putative transposase
MTPGRRRQVVDDLRGTWRVSIRRACSVVQAERSSYHFKSRRPDRAHLRTRIKEIAETRVCYGYRRIHVLLRREGWMVNVKAVNRLYREMGLQLRSKTPKRKVKAKLREGREAPSARNDVWAMDFVHDQLFDATKVRVLTILDTFTKYAPAIEPRFNWRGTGVVEVLERVCKDIGFPRSIRVDQGPEFISKDLDLWAYRRGVILDFSRPGKPTDNAFIESLNGKFRAECLNAHWFTSLDEMRRICEDWRRDYNEVRPHSAIGNKPPMALMNCSEAHGPL